MEAVHVIAHHLWHMCTLVHMYVNMILHSWHGGPLVHHFIGWLPGESGLAHYPNTVGFVSPLVPEQNFRNSDRNLFATRNMVSCMKEMDSVEKKCYGANLFFQFIKKH